MQQIFCKYIGCKKKLNPKPHYFMREREGQMAQIFLLHFISSDQILNKMNFNEGVGLKARLCEKHLQKSEVVKYFQSHEDR